MITKINEELELELTGDMYDIMKHINYTKANSIFQIESGHIQDVIESIIYTDFNLK